MYHLLAPLLFTFSVLLLSSSRCSYPLPDLTHAGAFHAIVAISLTRSVQCESGKGEVDHNRWTTPTYVGSLKVTLLPEQLTAVEL